MTSRTTPSPHLRALTRRGMVASEVAGSGSFGDICWAQCLTAGTSPVRVPHSSHGDVDVSPLAVHVSLPLDWGVGYADLEEPTYLCSPALNHAGQAVGMFSCAVAQVFTRRSGVPAAASAQRRGGHGIADGGGPLRHEPNGLSSRRGCDHREDLACTWA